MDSVVYVVQVLLSEEELAAVDQASATAAEVTGSMMRLKLELEEKKRTVTMLQTALVSLCMWICVKTDTCLWFWLHGFYKCIQIHHIYKYITYIC